MRPEYTLKILGIVFNIKIILCEDEEVYLAQIASIENVGYVELGGWFVFL